MSLLKFDAFLFDCDGVLVDSEAITHSVLCAMLNEAGWALSLQECMGFFLGRTVRSQAALIEAHTGRPLTDAWMAEFYARRNARLQQELQPIAGALELVRWAHHTFQGRIACASGADRHKVQMQLTLAGMAPYFDGHVFSGHELPRSKPAPDVYLAAAASLGVDPTRCLVLEDTVTGVTAGVAAGATVLGFVPTETTAHSSTQALLEAGAIQVLRHLSDLPSWFQQLHHSHSINHQKA